MNVIIHEYIIAIMEMNDREIRESNYKSQVDILSFCSLGYCDVL